MITCVCASLSLSTHGQIWSKVKSQSLSPADEAFTADDVDADDRHKAKAKAHYEVDYNEGPHLKLLRM